MPSVASSVRVRALSTNEDVVDPVTIHVAGRGDRFATKVTSIDAVEDEAVGAIQRREIEARVKPGIAAEDEVGLPSVFNSVRVGEQSTNKDVVDPITIHVAGRGDRVATQITCTDAVLPIRDVASKA